jgi:hypothetical protein
VVDAPADEQSTEFVVRVPALGGRGGDVAEHELKRAGSKGELAVSSV